MPTARKLHRRDRNIRDRFFALKKKSPERAIMTIYEQIGQEQNLSVSRVRNIINFIRTNYKDYRETNPIASCQQKPKIRRQTL